MTTPSTHPRAMPSPDEPGLFRWFPQLRESIAWLPLGRFPTPVESLQVDPIAAPMYVKRDDLAGTVYGGNKVRKLEFVLGDAKRQGVRRLITAGAAGSHHALATAVYGKALGFEVSLVLFPQHRTDHVREVLLLDHAYGADIHFVPRMEAVPLGIRAVIRAHRGERVLTIAPGGSDPLGTLGYVNAALELAEQIEAGVLEAPAAVRVPAGTLGTSTGLAIGFAMARMPTAVLGTRITSRILVNAWTLRRLVRRTIETLERCGVRGLDQQAVMDKLRISHGQIGRGYGYPTPDGDRATEVFAERGLVLDPTYTAKAAVDFLDGAQFETAGSAHLYWHTLSSVVPPLPDNAPGPDSLPTKVRRYLGTDPSDG